MSEPVHAVVQDFPTDTTGGIRLTVRLSGRSPFRPKANVYVYSEDAPAYVPGDEITVSGRISLADTLRGSETDVFTSRGVFLLIGFLAQYLPWTLVPRGTYIYHYFASVPFLIIAITLGAEQLRAKHSRTGKVFITVFLALAFAAFILFFPYVTGILAPVSWLDAGKLFLHIWY